MISFSRFGSGFASSGTISVTIPINNGDTVVVFVLANAAAPLTVTGVTDSGVSSYSQRQSIANGNSAQAFLWTTKASGGLAGNTVSVNLSGAYIGCSVIVLTYPGVGDLGAVTINTGTSSTPSITANVGAASSWAVGGIGFAANIVATANTGNLRGTENSGLLAASAGVDNTGGNVSDALTVNAGTPTAFAAVAIELIDIHVFDSVPGNQQLPVRIAFAFVLAASSGMAVIDPTILFQKEAPHVEAWMQPPQYPAAFESIYNRGSGDQRDYYPALYASGMAPIDPKLETQPEAPNISEWVQPLQYPAAFESKIYFAALYASGFSPIDPKLLTLKEAVNLSVFEPVFPSWLPRPYPFAIISLEGNQRNFARVNHPENGIWHAEYPNYLTRPYPEATYISSGCTFVPNPETELSRWFVPPSQPTFLPARTPGLGQFVEDTNLLEIIYFTKWFQPPSQPTRLLPRNVAVEFDDDPKEFIFAEASHVEAWMQPPQYPAAFEKKVYFQALLPAVAAYDPKPLAEAIRVEKFKANYPDIVVRTPARAADLLSEIVTDPSELLFKEAVTLDKFAPDYPNWIERRYPEAPYSLAGSQRNFTVINHPENGYWHPEYPSSLPHWSVPLPRRVPPGETFPDPGVQVTVDKWFQPASQPLPVTPKRAAILDQYVVDPSLLTSHEIVLLDKWGQPTNQPVRLPAYTTVEIIVDPNLIGREGVSLDKFHPSYADWIARVPDFATFITSGVYFQPPIVEPLNISSPFASSVPVENAQATVSDWNAQWLNPPPEQEDS